MIQVTTRPNFIIAHAIGSNIKLTVTYLVLHEATTQLSMPLYTLPYLNNMLFERSSDNSMIPAGQV